MANGGSEFRTAEELQRFAERRRGEYASANPFPHMAIDGMFPAAALDATVAEIDRLGNDHPVWACRDRQTTLKKSTSKLPEVGRSVCQMFEYLYSDGFTRFVETLTGIPNLIPDRTLDGSGIHLIERGGFLKIHADYNMQDVEGQRRYRRANLLVYLNHDWRDEYGGGLELWDTSMSQQVGSYSPIFNRAVIFTCSDESFHGHPDPLACPEGRARKSLALYYFTLERPDSFSDTYHSTLYQRRGGQAAKAG